MRTPAPAAPTTCGRRRAPTPTRLLLVVGLALLLAGVSGAAARALPRDVEVRDGAAPDGRLTIAPAVSLARDVLGSDAWDVVVANGTDVRVELDLSVVHLAPDARGAPTASDDEVAWALLPRDAIALDPGEVATFTIGLRPAGTDLPAAIGLVAQPVGAGAPPALLAPRVVWPVDHAPTVEVSADGDVLAVVSPEGPAIVDVRVRSQSTPVTGATTDVGPLVLLPGVPRDLEAAATGRTEVVVAVDGTEVARTTLGSYGILPLAAAGLLAATAIAIPVATRRRSG